ncbi:MAG: hypothetical protein ACK40G_14550 [Cytophagaceae bacterium]
MNSKLLILPLFFIVFCFSCKQSSKDQTEEVVVTEEAAVDSTTLPSGFSHVPYKETVQGLSGSLMKFVPENYLVLDTATGDLNLDTIPDMILVLKRNDEETTSDVSENPAKRPLLILIGQADNTFKLAAKNENTVYCIDCGGMMGDPYMSITIKKGYFSVEHHGGSAWRWTRIITYKYSPEDNYWYLHKDGHESFHTGDPEKVTTKILTKKDFGVLKFDEFDIYKEE